MACNTKRHSKSGTKGMTPRHNVTTSHHIYQTILSWTPHRNVERVVGFWVMTATAAAQFLSDHERRGSHSRVR